jgi:hypothetical protein
MPNQHNKPKPSEPQPLGSATRSLSLLLCLGALAGVLIWAKLRLVTDIPRSAYADPNETALPMDPEADEPAPDALPKEGMDEPSKP